MTDIAQLEERVRRMEQQINRLLWQAAVAMVRNDVGSFQGGRVLTAGSGISLTDGGAGSTLTVASNGLATNTPQFVTLAASSDLANERVLTAGTGIAFTDAGAGSTLTVTAPYSHGAATVADTSTINMTLTGQEIKGDVIPGGIDAADCASGSATDGYVLTADGSGGAAWESIPTPSQFVFCDAPLTSTSFDGDSFSTTSKTLIDLSAVFGVPAGIKAVLIRYAANDSGSASTQCYFYLSPNNTASQGPGGGTLPNVNDWVLRGCDVVPCDDNGDIYYQIVASGSGTFDLSLQIWGYQL